MGHLVPNDHKTVETKKTFDLFVKKTTDPLQVGHLCFFLFALNLVRFASFPRKKE